MRENKVVSRLLFLFLFDGDGEDFRVGGSCKWSPAFLLREGQSQRGQRGKEERERQRELRRGLTRISFFPLMIGIQQAGSVA